MASPTFTTNNFKYDIARSVVPDAVVWNKFGYNLDFGTTAEVMAAWGGSFTPLTSASTLTIVSSDAAANDYHELTPSHPFVLTSQDVLWFEATSTSANTTANVRFSLVEYQM